MKIEFANGCKVLSSIAMGECFRRGGTIYMRVEPEKGNDLVTVRMENGKIVIWDADIDVYPIKAYLRVVE